MKALLKSCFVLFAAVTLLTGCVASIGNEGGGPRSSATLGQQLIDLQKAKEYGVLTPEEFQEQKARLLGHGPRR